MTGALPNLRGTDEILEARGGFESELGVEQTAVVLIHPQRFRLVAFGKMNADERCLRGLAQWIASPSRPSSVSRRASASSAWSRS